MYTSNHKPEEINEALDNMSAADNDIFKHENESVDLLLKEMNQDPNTIDASEEVNDQEIMSVNNSPTKPLSFPKQVAVSDASKVNGKSASLDITNKEFNSSSDTCISESESPKASNQDNSNNASFGRNFSFDDSDEINKTIDKKIKREEEEFSFIIQTPITSTIDLNNPQKQYEETPYYNNTSPNKSIMKKSDSMSPSRKSVVFSSSIPEIHHYPANKSNITNTSQEESPEQLTHEWNEVPKGSLSQSSDDDNQTPPAPPMHTTDTFTSLLNDNKNTEDMDMDTLNELKLLHQNFSNLSLNEKLDVFLSNKHVKSEELDDHLTHLDNAVKNKTDTNIHYLSLDLKKQELDEVENPLNSLMKSSEVRLRSAGSSQSSLQSLVENNRYLESSPQQSFSNKGIELNDGIKGFSNHMVESLIPKGNTHLENVEDTGLMMKTLSNNRINELKMSENNDSEEEEFHDSFDTNTEQSIINLLKSPSNLDIREPVISNDSSQNVQVKEEHSNTSIKEESKNEDENEFSSDSEQFLVKSENIINDELRKEPEINYHDYEANSQIESVSGYGRTHKDIKLIKPEHNRQEDKTSEQSREIETYTAHNQASVDDVSELTEDVDKFSIRDHIDSNWKFEDSNDGDREDNDDYTNNEMTTINDNQSENKGAALDKFSYHLKDDNLLEVNLSPNVSEISQEFKDASDHFIGKTLAPRKLDEAIDATQPPIQVDVSDGVNQELKDTQDDHDENVLANSSNIVQPGEITLPPIETNNYSSFDDITKNLGKSNNSYEELLSAENDADNKPLNFISIWHSQEKQKKPYSKQNNNSSIPLSYSISKDADADTDSYNKLKFSSVLQPKKFREVNVMSRRVVSPGFEDIHVSGFLPELSEDSGFGNQFRSFRAGYNTSNMSNYSQLNDANNNNKPTPLNTRNILSNLDNDPNVIEPPKATIAKKESDTNRTLRPDIGKLESLKPRLNEDKILKPDKTRSQVKVSRFKVPSFEIKRTNSILSPRNQYDDIFEDVLHQPPTIKSHGMKTLPSMDRDDVKRILATKRVISQDEYSRVKLVGNSKKNSIVNEPNDKYDELQQQASICNASTESSPRLDPIVLPHLADELLRVPSALLSKDQLFNEFDSQPKLSHTMFDNNSQTPSRNGSVVHHENEPEVSAANYVLSDHHMTQGDEEKLESHIQNEDQLLKKDTHDVSSKKEISMIPAELSPKKRNPPIKIYSPKKDNGKRSSIIDKPLPSTLKKPQDKHVSVSSFAGDELVNNKIRESPTKDESQQPQNHEYKPSTVSVPSFYSNDTSNTKSSNVLAKNHQKELEKDQQQAGSFATEDKSKIAHLQERGRLFLRVIGLKSVDLPDIGQHNADFSITLDNGVHCIKTSNYKMDSHNTIINKEFELTVGDSLEFILTMKTSYEKSRGRLVEVKERKVVKSKNRLSRLFGSKDIITTTKFVPENIKDTWVNKIAQDGSFARCYVDLDQYESKITGQASSFNITCFNEWETYTDKNNGTVCRSQPYRIGQLEVKMLFVPRTDSQEILPTSIKSAYECIEDLRQEFTQSHQGYLHQEGGDCEIWKKRFFKLEGSALIAHSEFSHKTRAKINLSKVVDVIYVDEENIQKSSANYRNFSDVILVPHSFKIRFANGEVIDFGAPNRSEKLEWIEIFEKIVHRNKFRRQPWVKLMLEELSNKERQNERSRTKKLF